MQNKLWMWSFIDKSRSAYNFLATIIGKTRSRCTFLQNGKLCKWMKQKQTHITHNFHTTNYDEFCFIFEESGCQYMKRTQLWVVHQSRTIISQLYIMRCCVFNTECTKANINWFHWNMNCEYETYIRWWFNLHFHHINHKGINPQRMGAHLGLHYRFTQTLERVNWHLLHMWGTYTYPRKKKINNRTINMTKWTLQKQICGATKRLLEERWSKQVSSIAKRTLEKCMIETQSLGGRKTIIGNPISKQPPGDWRTNNYPAVIRRLKHKQSLIDCQMMDGRIIAW